MLNCRREPVFIKANYTTSLRRVFFAWDPRVSSVDDRLCRWWVGIWSFCMWLWNIILTMLQREKNIDWLPPVAETEQTVSSSLHCRMVVLQSLTRWCRPLCRCSRSFHLPTHLCLVLSPLFLYLLSHLCFSPNPLSQLGGGTDAA